MVGQLHKFELIDSRTFGLPRDPTAAVSATHLATIKWGLREFVYFRIDQTGQTYIEEVILKPTVRGGKITAKYQLIEDDNLWRDLAGFLERKGLTKMRLPYHNPYA
jgi:hypothetical protein